MRPDCPTLVFTPSLIYGMIENLRWKFTKNYNNDNNSSKKDKRTKEYLNKTIEIA
jgi:hypothetical protein